MTKQIEGYVALTEETVKELKAGDKIVYLGDPTLSDDSDLTVGASYEILESYGEGSDFLMNMVTGGYAMFIDEAGDECGLTTRTAQGFAKA